MKGKIIQYNCSFYFLNKKHPCPECAHVLTKTKRSSVVNSFSEEAKNYDFVVNDTFLVGDVEFVTYFFQCSNCGESYEIDDLKKIEKLQKTRTARTSKQFYRSR